jgi:hypothetical protein
MSLRELARLLAEGESAAERAAAAAAMTAHPSDPLAWSSLVDAEQDPAGEVADAAHAALDAIFTARPDLVVPFCARDEGEASPQYVANVARMVARLPTTVALDALFVALDRADPKAWTPLLEAAAPTSRFPTEDLLARLDDTADRNRRWVVAHVLAARGVDSGYRTLLDDYPSARQLDDFITRGIEPIQRLCALVYGDDPLAENDLAGRLAQRRNRAEGLVHQLVRDPTSKAAGIAVLVLGFWDDPRSVDALLQVARDASYPRGIRDDALESLGQLEAPEAVDVLCEALADPAVDTFVKRNCAAALGYIGQAEALPALEAIVHAGASRELVVAARHAIEEIEESAESAG